MIARASVRRQSPARLINRPAPGPCPLGGLPCGSPAASSAVLDTRAALVLALRADLIHHRMFLRDDGGKLSKQARAVSLSASATAHANRAGPCTIDSQRMLLVHRWDSSLG